jgi:hypothetical protein
MPGIGKILGLTIMLEVGDIRRFEGPGNFRRGSVFSFDNPFNGQPRTFSVYQLARENA